MSTMKFERLVEEGKSGGDDKLKVKGQENEKIPNDQDKDRQGQVVTIQHRVISVSQLPSARICCGMTVRAWTKVGIILNMIFFGLGFAFLSLAVIGIFAASADEVTSITAKDGQEYGQAMLELICAGGVLVVTIMIFCGICFVISMMALHAVNTGNTCMMAFWSFLLILGVLEESLRFAAILFTAGIGWDQTFISFLSLSINIFFLYVTLRHRDEMVQGKVLNVVSMKLPV